MVRRITDSMDTIGAHLNPNKVRDVHKVRDLWRVHEDGVVRVDLQNGSALRGRLFPGVNTRLGTVQFGRISTPLTYRIYGFSVSLLFGAAGTCLYRTPT
jgi:hypothetical protein